jgi:predicted nuclease of predicted toxin-antitoxin system
MKFIVDAQLPFLLVELLNQKGCDAIHTDDLDLKERTTDNEIRVIEESESRIVITKDDDFLDSYLIKKSPPKLLLVTKGNIKNRQLLDLFRFHIRTIVESFGTNNYLELNNDELIIHE